MIRAETEITLTRVDDGIPGAPGPQGPQGEQGTPGPQGEPGADGADGKTSYFHIKYSSVANPTSSSQMTETPSTYIGTYVDFTEADSTDPRAYTWSRFEGIQGEHGERGIPGTNGADGKTSYLHIAYANSADGTDGFSVSDSTGKLYIGQYTDFVQADSTVPSKYAWTKIKGETGADGEMSAEQIAQLNQASEDASQAKSDVANLEIGGRNLLPFKTWCKNIQLTNYTEPVEGRFSVNGSLYKTPFIFGEIGQKYTFSSKPYTQGTTRLRLDIGTYDGTTFTPKDNLGLGGSDGAFTKYLITRDDVNAVRVNYTTASTPIVLDQVKIEKGNKATDWTPAPEDVQDTIDEAAKTATDFIKPQSTSMTDDGIKIFPKSEKDNPQNYAQINQQGMQIYKDGQRAASFGSEKISLGENSEQSVLEMCGGLTNLSSEVKVDEFGNKIGYILLAPTERAQSKDYPFRCGIASGKRDATIYLGDAECSMDTHLTPGGAASINIIQSEISGSSEFDLNEEYPEDGPYAFTRMGMHAVMGLTNGNEPGASISVNAYLNGSTVESLLEMYADKITINGEPLADFVVARGTSGLWTYEKWNSGKAVAYMPKFYTYSNLTMKAAGNLYMSEERNLNLPTGLFVDTNYIVSHEIQSSGGPVSIVRQSGSTNAKFLFKVYKVYNSSTGVALKFRVKGRWK